MKSWSLRRLTSNGLRFGPSSQAIVSNERRGILPAPIIRQAIVLLPAPALPRRTSLISAPSTLLKANENYTKKFRLFWAYAQEGLFLKQPRVRPFFDLLDVDSNCNRGAGHRMCVMRILPPLWKEIPHTRRHLAEFG